MENNLPLSEFLHTFSKFSNIHISIHDFSGILSHPDLKLEFRDRIHIKRFCDVAKSTKKGFSACLRCKYLANKKALTEQKLFYGLCQYGLFEVGLPIVQNGKTLAVIYVGNIVCDLQKSKAKALRTCKHTGVDFNVLEKEFDNAYIGQDITAYINIARAVESYIKLVLKTSDFRPDMGEHWLIKELRDYAKSNYRSSVQLKDVATLYGFNEKYLGRLFLKKAGTSFTKYVNSLRLNQAEAELKATEKSIIDISLDAGFENVTYFNRLFKQKHGITPRQFRA